MAKTKRSILMLLACVFLFSVAALIFTACSTPSYTVTFLVQNDATDEWEQYATETSEEGVVTLPNNPTKTDYVFRNWYDNTDFTGDPFTGENVEGDMNVYAYFVPTEISINVTKSEDDVDEDTVYVRDLETLKEQYEAEALAANLTFDGWYTGADYDTLWTSSSDVDVVYGRFMAQIVYDNGFETYEPFTVQAGTTISEPTLEYIQKSYMDDEDIYYVVGDDYQIYNDNGVVTGYDEYDFSQPVTENMTITVLWKTPYLLYNVNANGTYTIAGIGANLYGINKNTEIQDYLNSLPVISLPAYVTASDDVDGVFFTNPGAVESIEMHQSLNSSSYYLASVQKVIVQEGIKWIYGIKGSSTVEEVVLPSTLKGMERSLNNLTGLQSVTIPDGVEVIINSLWYSDVTSKQNTTYESYDFNIEIPASVKNMAMMPAKNLTFAEGSPFFIEDNALYLRKGEDDLVLINSYNVENGELHVKESVTGIQVGAFFYNKDVDYVYLPSTFAYMNENELHTTYPYALSSYKSNARSTTVGGSYLDCTNFTYGSVRESQSSGGIMLYDNLGDDEILTFIFNTTSYPSTLDDDAFCDGKTSWTAYPNANYVIFVGNATADEDVTVSLTAYNASTQQSQYITFTQKTGTQLTSNAILKALQDAEKASSLSVTSVTYLGNTYALPAELTGNVYLDVEYVYTENGFTYTIENDEAIVTGLSGSAIKLSSGYYYVNITSTVTDNAIEYPVTEIADEAFMGDAVGIVNIANSVKKIGNSAFENCVNLTSVTIAPGGLEYIGDHAFEDTAFTTITLPLANVTYIGPYAFKSAALQRFIPAEGESYIGTLEITASSTEMKVGKYYLYNGGYNNYDDDYVCFIIRYTGVGTEYSATYSNQSEKTTDVTVYDVDLVAIAGGMRCRTLNLGVSGRARFNRTYVIRYSVQEGSVYYLSDSRMTSIVFGIVKNVEQNAFTDIDEKFWVTTESGTYKGKVYRYEMTNESFDVYDCWLTQAQVAGIASKDYNFSAADAIFEDGWFNGITVEDESYETTMRFISDTYLGVYSSIYDLGTNVKQNIVFVYVIGGPMQILFRMGSAEMTLDVSYDAMIKVSDTGYTPLSGDAYCYADSFSAIVSDELSMSEYEYINNYGTSIDFINFYYSALSADSEEKTMYSHRITISPVGDTTNGIATFGMDVSVYGYDAAAGNLYANLFTDGSLKETAYWGNEEVRSGNSYSAGDTIDLEEIFYEKVAHDGDFSDVTITAYLMSGDTVDYAAEYDLNGAVRFTFTGQSISLVQSDGTAATPSGNITLYLQADMTYDRNEVVVYHMAEDGTLTELSADGYGRYVKFDTDKTGTFIACIPGVAFVMPMWGYAVILVACVLVVAAAITIPIVVVKKRKKKTQSGEPSG